MSVATGSDVESLCNKCGDVWHVVVAMVGDKIAKVQCKQCNAYHRYRDPSGKKKAASTRKKSAATTSKSTTKAKKTTVSKATVDADMSKPIRPYSPKDNFEPAERIEHPKFGIGVVQSVANGKADVFFGSFGTKVLATARPATKMLSRPPRFDR